MPTRDELNRLANGNNPFEEPPLRISAYTAREVATLQSRLERQLGPEYISTRPGPGGSRVHYLGAEKVIGLANEVFGFNGWSTEIKQVQIDFVDESQSTGKISLGLSIVVRVILKDGTFHEDIGYGQIDNCKGKGAAFMKAKKEAVTDGLKRALRNFGNVVGNCLYDKDYLQKVTKIKPPPLKWDPDQLHRHASYRAPSLPTAPPTTEGAGEPLKGSRTESDKTQGTSPDFEDDFEGNLFEGVEFDSGDPDEIMLGPAAGVSERRVDDRPKQNLGPGHPPPPAAKSSGPTLAPAQQHEQQKRPQQSNLAAPATSRPVAPNAKPSGQTLDHPAHPPRQVQAGPPHLSAVPPQLSGNNAPPAPVDAPSELLGFVTGRAPELFQAKEPDEILPPLSAHAPAFNPHSESPSIRRTTGVDHNKSVPVKRGNLAPGAPAAAAGNATAPPPHSDHRPPTRANLVNPQADMGRRIGMPSAAQSPLTSRGGYRPPAMQKRGADGSTRPALADVSNVQLDGGGGGIIHGGGTADSVAKRAKMEM